MIQSKIFTKTSKDLLRDEKSINSQLLIRASFIDKLMAGVYSFLPLGLLVLRKIERIIRQEINKIGGQEIFLPSLHPKERWEKTGRWKIPEIFKLKNRQGKDLALGWTHEEIVIPLVQKFVKSYKDLPVFVYQIQNKFRDELRPKSGLLRCVEFLMKDLYSFHASENDLDRYYEKVKEAYFKIFKRCGLEKYTFLTLASGGTFSDYSHEFQTITPFGEDTIFLCQKCNLAINKEIFAREKKRCSNCLASSFEVKKAIEVGNIFKLKDKFSRFFDFNFLDKDGKKKMVLMGCYGIGLGRLMGAVVEVHHDEKGIIWPEAIAPFQFHLIPIEKDKIIRKTAEKIYHSLQKKGYEVLYDDRDDKSPGEKLIDADLLGIPTRLVISRRTLQEKSLEVKKRNQKRGYLVKLRKFNLNV
jgi:prolyl-tRNA synthetase